MSTYKNYDDLARLEYGHILWRNPRYREELIGHWTDSCHPHREHFLWNRALVERLLASRPEDDSIFESELIQMSAGTSKPAGDGQIKTSSLVIGSLTFLDVFVHAVCAGGD